MLELENVTLQLYGPQVESMKAPSPQDRTAEDNSPLVGAPGWVVVLCGLGGRQGRIVGRYYSVRCSGRSYRLLSFRTASWPDLTVSGNGMLL